MTKVTVEGIYGPDVDLLSEGVKSFAPVPRLITRNLRLIHVRPGDEFPQHRGHLSSSERLLIRIMLEYRYSPERGIPSVHVLAEEADLSYQHACRCIRYLEQQGLLSVTREVGVADDIDISPLIERMRDLLGRKQLVVAVGAPIPLSAPVTFTAAEAGDAIARLLQQAIVCFGELLSAPQDAYSRLAHVQDVARWSDEQLAEEVNAAIGRVVTVARSRRFGLFSADLDRRVAEVQCQTTAPSTGRYEHEGRDAEKLLERVDNLRPKATWKLRLGALLRDFQKRWTL